MLFVLVGCVPIQGTWSEKGDTPPERFDFPTTGEVQTTVDNDDSNYTDGYTYVDWAYTDYTDYTDYYSPWDSGYYTWDYSGSYDYYGGSYYTYYGGSNYSGGTYGPTVVPTGGSSYTVPPIGGSGSPGGSAFAPLPGVSFRPARRR
ncbi:MAG: hypothetical protein ABMA64_04470 [Myxococcota bacterium]